MGREQQDILNTIIRVLKKGQFILGNELKAFESEVSSYYGKKYAIGVNSGTDALLLALDALGISKGDEVITTPFTFIAPAEAIAKLKATPVFCDIRKDFLINPEEIKKKITQKTKAIIAVNLFGQSCDPIIKKMAGKIPVIEDCAQAFGNKKIGWGDIQCFSFHPSKSLGGIGDGGMVLTNNKKIANKILLLRNHGAYKNDKYNNLIVGYNSRLDEIQAAVLRVKLRYFKKKPIKHLYTFTTPNRDLVKRYLDKLKIDNKIFYDKLLHLQPCFKYLGYKKGDFPVAEKISKECLSINVYE